MKVIIRLFFAIFISTIAVSSMHAQSHFRRSFYGDFFAGMTFASMDIEKGNEFKTNKIGFMIGGNGNLRFYKNMILQTGFHIVKKGSLKHEDRIVDLEGPLEKIDIKQTVDANYIQIPLNLGLEVPIKKNLLFNLHAGVFGAYGFKGETKQRGYKVTIINGKPKEPTSEDKGTTQTFSNTNLKKWDYGVGVNFGLVYDIYILRFQYDHGLANVATDALGGEWKTRNYMLCFGFRF